MTNTQLVLPLPVRQSVNPLLGQPCGRAPFNHQTNAELVRHGVYHLIDLALHGDLRLFSGAVQADVTATLRDSRVVPGSLPDPYGWGRAVPYVALQQHSLVPVVNEALGRISGHFALHNGLPTPITLALLPELAATPEIRVKLGELLAHYGLRPQMKIEELFVYQPAAPLTASQVHRCAVSLHDLGLSDELLRRLLPVASQQPTVLDAYLILQAAEEDLPELRAWFQQHDLPTGRLSLSELNRITTYVRQEG